MHVSPNNNIVCDYKEKRNYQKGWLQDRQSDRQTDDGLSDPYVPLCSTGDTKGFPKYKANEGKYRVIEVFSFIKHVDAQYVIWYIGI